MVNKVFVLTVVETDPPDKESRKETLRINDSELFSLILWGIPAKNETVSEKKKMMG